MPVLLWVLPPCLVLLAIRWSLRSPHLSSVQRNGLLAGLAGAGFALVVLDIACCQRLLAIHGARGFLTNWRLPAIPAIAALFAIAGGWAMTILYLGLRSVVRQNDDPNRPRTITLILAGIVLPLLAWLFLFIAPLLAPDRDAPIAHGNAQPNTTPA